MADVPPVDKDDYIRIEFLRALFSFPIGGRKYLLTEFIPVAGAKSTGQRAGGFLIWNIRLGASGNIP
jgi:hypothetical protein